MSAVLAAALACWIVAARGPGMMGGLGPFVAVWVTAMAAMMLPSAAPMVSAVAAFSRGVPVFVAGYLAVWTGFGVAAYWIGTMLPSWSWLAGAGLVLAGLYQLTPLKDACLRRCRDPVGFLVGRRRTLSLVLGLEHGAWCAGCCAGLMVALFALGMSSLAWMAAVALLILAEKALPGGELTARASGIALVAAGAVVLA